MHDPIAGILFCLRIFVYVFDNAVVIVS